jgi:hypothetical protein
MKFNANGKIFAILSKITSVTKGDIRARTRKGPNYIYFDQLLFLLSIMQRDTSGNITPPPRVKDSEPQDITTGNEMREGSHAKNATYYMQQKKRSKTWRIFIGNN